MSVPTLAPDPPPDEADADASPGEAGAPTSTGLAPATCANCDAERLGDYCQSCGQHYLDDRLTLRLLWREFAQRFLKMERGLGRTLVGLTRSPGRVAREYVTGRRRTYVNPLSYLLLGAAVSLLLMPLYSSPDHYLGDGANSSMFEQSLEIGFELRGRSLDDLTPEKRARIDAFMEVYVVELFGAIKQLNSALSLILAALMALCLKLLFGGSRTTFTLAETLVLTLFVCGQYLLLASLLMSAVASLGPAITTALGLLPFVALVIAGTVGFYGWSWGNAALGLLTAVVSYSGYIVVLMATAAPLAIYRARPVLEAAQSASGG